MSIMTTIKVKTWLVFAHRLHPVLRRLNLTLLREVGRYLTDTFYPCVFGSTLSLWNLERGQVSVKSLSHYSFNSGASYCMYSFDRLLCVGDSELSSTSAFSLCIHTAEVTSLANMKQARAWAGLISWRESIYVFGGNYDLARLEAEKYTPGHNQWTELGPMPTPKACFSPLLHQEQFYLIATSTYSLPIDTFNPVTETYQSLPVTIEGAGYGAVSFLKGQEIVVILYGGHLIKWNPQESKYKKVRIELPDSGTVASNAPVCEYRGKVYWAQYNSGKLMQFDLNSDCVAATLVTNMPKIANKKSQKSSKKSR